MYAALRRLPLSRQQSIFKVKMLYPITGGERCGCDKNRKRESIMALGKTPEKMPNT